MAAAARALGTWPPACGSVRVRCSAVWCGAVHRARYSTACKVHAPQQGGPFIGQHKEWASNYTAGRAVSHGMPYDVRFGPLCWSTLRWGMLTHLHVQAAFGSPITVCGHRPPAHHASCCQATAGDGRAVPQLLHAACMQACTRSCATHMRSMCGTPPSEQPHAPWPGKAHTCNSSISETAARQCALRASHTSTGAPVQSTVVPSLTISSTSFALARCSAPKPTRYSSATSATGARFCEAVMLTAMS